MAIINGIIIGSIVSEREPECAKNREFLLTYRYLDRILARRCSVMCSVAGLEEVK